MFAFTGATQTRTSTSQTKINLIMQQMVTATVKAVSSAPQTVKAMQEGQFQTSSDQRECGKLWDSELVDYIMEPAIKSKRVKQYTVYYKTLFLEIKWQNITWVTIA
jgi:hypothetical protein